ncbi:SGNH/GDSL hydrolase family protein [Sphingomonas sp. BAUL-RG-20F-R05-02]|uniref:SGNH/GDSL hydrolase family protein n=1 Tax=Sphingomonas sp. BAUL-RG-20F-R05-02 TaxID=2914830 RepID=UPI001F5AD88E|nr:SGNH/GDSL hydrolase family protein [Sphingomonas sp. BAUL-RG-20F-R05-02]
MRRLKWLGAAVVAATLIIPTVSTAASYDRLYVFGDSLVDSGNAATQVPGSAPSSGRFTNGLNFADDLSLALGFGLSTAYLQGGTNYAVGGSTVATFYPNQVPPDLGYQISGYYEPSTTGAVSPPARRTAIDTNSLVLVTAGGNDIRDYGRPGAPSISDTVSAFQTDLTRLVTDGARNIIVVGLPDVGQIPSVYGTARQDSATQASAYLNLQYAAIVGGIQQTLGASGSIRMFDLAGLQTTIQNHPTAYGLDPALVHSSCVGTGGLANNCAGYLYYDGIHPTAYVHSLIADGIVASVPEPSTWLTMIIGFALIGASLRRRGRTSIAAIA